MVAAVLGVAVGTVALAAPSVAATACPQCYGLSGLGGGVYTDRDDTGYRQMIDAAGQRITAFYGGQEHHGRVLICASAACYDRIGGGAEKGRALPTGALMLSPAGATETIATHELSHLEFHERLGATRDRVPHWFDEGLAVLVSDDDRYLKPAGEADRCRLPYEEAAAVVHTDWAAAAAATTADGTNRGYLQAACVVSHWTADHGGPPAVLHLITDLRAGKTFTVPN